MKTLTVCFRSSILILLILLSIATKAQVPMHGTYYIGGVSYDYLNFQAAVTALVTNGVDGPVTFKVNSGTYTEHISIPPITGASSTNTIEFVSTTLNPEDVVLTYAAVTYGSQYTVRLSSAKYVTLRKITIEGTGTTYASAVIVENDADYNTIDSCHLIVPVSTNSSKTYQEPFLCDQLSVGNAVNADYMTIKNCEITGGVYGIYFRAYTTGGLRVNGTVINNNKFLQQSTYGLYLIGHSGIFISNNTIVPNSASTVDYSGALINSCEANSQIVKNNIYGSNTSGDLTGIQFGNSYTYSGEVPLIANNIISLTNTAGDISGLYFWNINNTDVINNTIVTNADNAFSSKTCNLVSGIDTIKILNNIFKNITANDTSYAIYKTYNTGYPVNIVISNNNDLISYGSYLCAWDLTNCANLGSWQTASENDSSSMSVNITFDNESIKPVLPFISEINDSLRVSQNSRVTDDYFGQNRLIPTCVGADERHAPICGNRTIGPSGCDYTSFTDAMADWIFGICGPLSYTVRAGTYNESFTIAHFKGYPLNYPVTFIGETGNPNDVMIISDTTAVMTLDSVSNISFNFIGFHNNSTTTGIVVDIVKGCDSISFNHCFLEGVSSSVKSTNGYQIVRVYDVLYSQSKNTDYLTFDSCSFVNGSCAIEYVENSSATPVYGEAIHITDCYFYNQKLQAMRLCGINNAIITNNYFTLKGWIYGFSSVNLEQIYGKTQFSNNRFDYSANAEVSLIYIGPGNKAVTDSLFFINNMVSFDLYSKKSSGPPDTLKNITGINLYMMDYNNFLYNNTIAITSRKSGKALWIYNSNYTELKNNIIINRATSDGCAMATQYVDSLVSVNNDFYCTGSNLIISEGDTLGDLASWKTTFPNYDTGSISKDVELSDMHLTVVSEADQDLWKPRLSEVTTDYDGEERSIYLSCIGADERTLSSGKAILTFAFDNGTAQYGGAINEGAKTISLEVPKNATLSGNAIFTNSIGSVVLFDGSVEKSNSVVHDFSSVLNFMVVASDNSSTSYTVTTNLITANSTLNPVSNVYFYPNPTNGFIKIKNINQSESSNISIFNIYGAIVKTFRIEKSNIETSVDLTDLKTGLYFISDGKTILKLIKQ